jgi:hypothetical protein
MNDEQDQPENDPQEAGTEKDESASDGNLFDEPQDDAVEVILTPEQRFEQQEEQARHAAKAEADAKAARERQAAASAKARDEVRRAQLAAESDPDEMTRLIALVRRNPTLRGHDETSGPVAKTWKRHLARANEIATASSPGSTFFLVQRRREARSFWVTEWTVCGLGDEKYAQRRRAAHGKTLSEAFGEFHKRLSFHNSHYYRPEDGVIGWFQRNNGF